MMQRRKRFKWSREDYTLPEFIEHFSYRLPVTIYITEGWMGRDEVHTFSSDEIYRIGTVKRQKRIVTEHGSGYYVSIPVKTRKKVDLFYLDGRVERSATMEDVPKAMKSRSRKPASLMFVNDKSVPFSFGPDEGANVNLGKMRIVDLYEERYLVGHSHWDGKLIDRRIPVAIPVYMDLRVAPAVGLVGGTDEDFHKVLADIEDQMTDAGTEVDVYEEIILFSSDITSNEYEFINPMATISKSSAWGKTAMEVTQSAAYSGNVPPERGTWRKAHKKSAEVPRGVFKRALPRSPPPDPRASPQPTVENPGRSTASPVILPSRPRVLNEIFTKTLPAKKHDGSVTTGTVAPFQMSAVFTCGQTSSRSTAGAITNTAGAGKNHAEEQTKKDSPDLFRSTCSTNCSFIPQGSKSISDVRYDLPSLSVTQLADRLRTLKIPETCVTSFINCDVDGEMLTSLDEQILTDEFHFSRFNAIKLMKHVREGYFPNY